MSVLRCALLAPNPTAGLVPSVLSTLHHLKDVVVEAFTDVAAEPRRWTGLDGAIVVFDRASLSAELEQIARILSANPCCSVIAVGDALDEDEMLSLLAAGVSDFVASPFAAGELKARVRRALGLTPTKPIEADPVLDDLRVRDLIGASTAFLRQTAKLPMLARHDVGVLLLGETGTGKEVFAQAIHYLSPRASKPWVALNCAAIPAELIESELFGHVRGAYTTAHAARKGLVSEADGGTLLLDEIDCLSYGAQAKLLRFLADKEFRPVGSNALCHSDVRVIATSNSPLGDLAAKGTFRRDLYFRLNVLSVTLPPLRETIAEIEAPIRALGWAVSERHVAAARGQDEVWALVPARLQEGVSGFGGADDAPAGQSLKFSVIMPTYRRGHCLNATIATILAQSYRNWELIVIDNFGDGRIAIADPRITTHVHVEKHSAAYARNAGLSYATGDLVCFFDDDDDMYPGYLEGLAAAFRNPRTKMARCGMADAHGRVNYSFATPEVCLRREYAEPTWAPDGPCQDQHYYRRIVSRHGWTEARGDIVTVHEPLCRANHNPAGGLRAGAL